MCDLSSEIAKRDPQEEPANQGEQENDRDGAPKRGHPLLQELPTVGGLAYSRAHETSLGPL
jgi:hypothetical protein